MQKVIADGFRLSPQQSRLWLLQRGGEHLPYRTQCAILIEGNLDVGMLRMALARVVERNEILRTNFQSLPGMAVPVQVIGEGAISLNEYRVEHGVPARDQKTLVETAFREANLETFDLENGPLLHASLSALAPEKHLLFISLPAMCADASTLGNLVREIGRCYAGGEGEESFAEPLQYADVAEWQNEIIESEDAAVGKEVWRGQSLSSLQTFGLPFELRPSERVEFGPRVLALELSANTRTRVESVTASHESSAAAFFLACWQTLLYRITLEPELVVGVGLDGRNYPELEGALGLLAKCLPIKTSLDERRRFDEVLAAANQALGEAARWQECFIWEPSGGAGENAVEINFFPLGFEFHQPPAKYIAGDVSFSIDRQYVCTDRFKVKLCCWQGDEGLRVEFHHDANLIPASYIERLSEQFQTLLENALREPEASIGELEILSAAERYKLLVEYNDTSRQYPTERCVHRLFEEQAAARPGAVALVFENEQLTYGELNARVNQLARHLQALGVGPETRVGICVERSLEMVVGLLGTLKAGGAYVPLDPALPRERLAFMLEDAGIEILLTQQSARENLPTRVGTVICLDTDWEKVALEATANPETTVSPSNLAYVIYTSGSTGQPKGVCIEHRQLLNYLRGITERLRLTTGEQFAMISTFAADLGNTALFPSLCAGACLHVISHERASDATMLAEYFSRHPVDCLKIVPSHLKALLASSRPELILPRRVLVLGGEPSHWDLIKTVRRSAPDCVVFNHYGPTETTVGALAHSVSDERRGFAKAVPLGGPLANTRVYLLDSRLTPAPVCVAGELYIGGKGVARGYLNRPDLTAEKFIPDPFGDEPGARMYRTGDMARHLPEGGLEFLGRNDHQVKVRGFRIELAEIERALLQHPSVREAVVTAWEGEDDEKRVVAYVTTGGRPAPAGVELRSFLRERLPEYMIPAALIQLEAFPLTLNGKVDRQALPAPDQARPETTEYTAPLNEIEDILVSVWQKILNLELVGVHDDYFALGGDSIRVIQIVHEVSQYNLPLTAMDIFQHPTVYALARHISESQGRERGDAGPPPLELVELPPQLLARLPEGIEDAYPASKMQEFVIHHYAHDRQQMGVYHIQHAYHIRDEGLSLQAFRRALEILVQRHPALRTVFIATSEHGLIQAVKREVTFTLREEHLEGLSVEEQERFVDAAIERDRARPFDVTQTHEPLFRFTAFLRSADTMEFLMSVHHALTDGWGNRELTNELIELYQSLKEGVERPFKVAPNTYKEFVAIEREIISSEGAREFWRKHLSETRRVELRRLPEPDRSPETNYFISFETDLAKRIQKLSRELRVSMKAIFLSAYLELVGAWLGTEPVTVGVVANGRSERLSEALKALGLFWNIIPFCSSTETEDGSARIRAVQQLLIDAEQYARYPLAQILEDRQTTELFSATFNFLHFHNMKALPDEGGLSLLGMKAHDKFHFPLSYIVSINSFTGNIACRVEYDKAYFKGETIRSMTDDYINRLTRLCDR